jgi:NADH pyrophosphatase NudC (nudix superfamily)
MNASEYRFCPRCSGRLEEREIKAGEPERLVCEACDFVFYQGPKLVAGALFELDGGIVLVQRDIEPGYGKWTFPGGFVDRGGGDRRPLLLRGPGPGHSGLLGTGYGRKTRAT